MEEHYESMWLRWVLAVAVVFAMLPDVSFAETRFYSAESTTNYEPVKFSTMCTYSVQGSIETQDEWGGSSLYEDVTLRGGMVRKHGYHQQENEYGPWGFLEVPISMEIAQKLIAIGTFNGPVWSEAGEGGMSLEEVLGMGHTVYSPRLVISQHRGSHSQPELTTTVDLAFDFFNPERVGIETNVQSSQNSDPWSGPTQTFLRGIIETCPDASPLDVYQITASSEYSSYYSAAKLIDGSQSSYWYSQQGMTEVQIDIDLQDIATVRELEISWNYYSCSSVELQVSEPWSGGGDFRTIAFGHEGALPPENDNVKLRVVGDEYNYIPAAHSYRVLLQGCSGYYVSASEITLKGFAGEAYF